MKITFSTRRLLGPLVVAPCWCASFNYHIGTNTIIPWHDYYHPYRSREGSSTLINRRHERRRNHLSITFSEPFTTSSLARRTMRAGDDSDGSANAVVIHDSVDTIANGAGLSPSVEGDSRDWNNPCGSIAVGPTAPVKVFPAFQYNALVESYGRERIKLVFLVRHAEGTHNVNRDYKSLEQLDAKLTPLGVQQCEGLQNELLGLKLDRGDGINSDNDNDINPSWESTDNASITEFDYEGEKDSDESNHRHRTNLRYLVDRNNRDDICVMTSTMTRCIQTALLSFDFLRRMQEPSTVNNHRDHQVPFVALEALRETVNYSCDRRRRISELSEEFPDVDFSNCNDDEDGIWNTYQNRVMDLLSISLNNNDNNNEDDIRTWDGHMESAELHVVAKRGREFLNFLHHVPQSKIVVCTHSAYLRCILNWGQSGGVPRMMEQRLDDRPIEDKTRDDTIPLFDYCCMNGDEGTVISFEDYMREDYDNAELRSFCVLVQS
jgi:broad specificity phosphatase PhoE